MIFGDSSSSKDLIFKILSEEWPLSAKEIYSRVAKISSKEISYQAVHKTLNSLIDERVFEKKDGKYLLNLYWVSNTKDILSKLETNLGAGKVVSSLNQKFVFDSIYSVDKFLVESCKNFIPNKNDVIVLQWIHFWIPLFISKDTYNDMKDLILNSNFYSITPNTAPIDKWCAKFWEDIGVKEKIGVKVGFDLSFMVYKDLIIQVFYPAKIRKAMDDAYNSTNDPSKLDIDNFFSTVFEKKTRIPVLVSRNKEVADELKSQIKSFF